MSHKKATGVAGLAALALVLTACTGTQSPGGGSNGAAGKQRIVVSLDSEISVLEPQTFRTLGAFAATADSGTPTYNAPGTIQGSALEGSNTDIADEFTKLIVTQQAYSANTRVITTTNTMVQDLLNMLR